MNVFYCSTCFECYYIHPQELATVCRCIVLFWCVPIHQYTPKQNYTPTYSRQLLRMDVITFETRWAIKTSIKWHQVGSIYSTIQLHTTLVYEYYYSQSASWVRNLVRVVFGINPYSSTSPLFWEMGTNFLVWNPEIEETSLRHKRR